MSLKVALLLPGYLDSPEYLHMKVFAKKLEELGYTVERIDPCSLWKTGDVNNYTITSYIKQVSDLVEFYSSKNPEEIILIGHSLGAYVAIIVGNRMKEVTKIVALCPAADRIDASLNWQGKEFRHSDRDLPDNPEKLRAFDIPDTFAIDGMQYSAVEEVKDIHKPLMIFIALDDKDVPPSETERVVNNANNPHVVRQPNMDHNFRKSEKETNIVMKEIEKFLTKLD
ncbi:MAG: prolyl oligopeptidase family serine peptidase [Candidatus Daviesbacteria bacterium]|nr:prolyl oligopeptidase family serine peptidase [Candidatus Daviesbacteria bacterium]